jgi:ABC-2 type transport system ATP-binding protein
MKTGGGMQLLKESGDQLHLKDSDDVIIHISHVAKKFGREFAVRTLFITTQYVSEAAYCDIVGVINDGALLFVDTPDGLRRTAYGGDLLDLHTVDPLQYELMPAIDALPCVERETIRVSDTHLRLTVDQAHTSIPRLLNWCRERDVLIRSVEEYLPSFDDVFVQLIESRGDNG